MSEENFKHYMIREINEQPGVLRSLIDRYFDFENKQIIIDMILSGADIKQQAVLKTRVFDTLSYFLPIPERELIFNQNLKQNPFYDR